MENNWNITQLMPIHANTNLYEIKIIYDLAHLEEGQIEPKIIGITESLIFSAGHFVIKFIQNLCEEYNREYDKE